METSEIEH